MEATKPFLISFAKVSIISETRKLFSVFLYSFKLYFILETYFLKITLYLYIISTSNPQPIGFRGNLLVKRQKFFYCTYSLGITETS